MAQSTDEWDEQQIEENVRFCEELLRRNPGFTAEATEFEWEETDFTMPEQQKPSESVVSIPVAPAPSGQWVEEEAAKLEKGGVLRTVRSLLVCVAVALLAGILITKFVANHTTVEGSSMEPALQDGDNLVVEKVSYLIGKPDRFDIIVFQHSESTNYIKRIIGLPGERVRIDKGTIYINDEPMYDAHSDGSRTDGGLAAETVTLGADEYFVLGDNRDASEDSRNENVGPVSKDKIVGRAWLRVTPMKHFGVLE